MSVQIVDAARLRALVGFEDLIEPVSRAFQDFSAGLAQCAIVTMFPASEPTLGDVYVKTGCIRGHSHYLVKVSPWFAANRDLAQPQGDFLAVFDSATGHTAAILNDEHYLKVRRLSSRSPGLGNPSSEESGCALASTLPLLEPTTRQSANWTRTA